MNELIDKIQRQLDDNHYIEAEDIQKLIDNYKHREYPSKWQALEDAQCRIIKKLESYDWTHEEIKEVVELLWNDK